MYPAIVPAMPASIVAKKKYGVSRSSAIYTADNIWFIMEENRKLFPTFYLLSWEAAYFKHQLHEGTITREGVTYQVKFHRCSSVEVIKYTGKLLLSFRALQPEYDTMPVVLVTIKDTI